MSTNVPTQSKFSLVRAISAFLKLGDDGKLESFFTRVVKSLGKEVTANKKNLDNLKFNHEQELDDLNDKLEDAKAAADEAYFKVDMSRIGNNADQAEFQEEYLESIDSHEAAIQNIEIQIEAKKKNYEVTKEKIENSIKSLEKRIAKISAE